MLTACESGTSTVEVEWDTAPLEEVVVEPMESEPAAETYTWEKHGLSFEVPEGLMVSDHNGIDALLLDTQDLSTFEGDSLGQLSIRSRQEANIAEVVAVYSDEKAFSQEEVTINGKTYTHVFFYSEFGDYIHHMFLVENEGTVYSVNKYWTGEQADLELLLETLEFSAL